MSSAWLRGVAGAVLARISKRTLLFLIQSGPDRRSSEVMA